MSLARWGARKSRFPIQAHKCPHDPEAVGWIPNSRNYFVHPHFRHPLLVMRNRQVIEFQLWDKDRSLRPERSRYVANPLVMIRIALLEDINELACSEINTLTRTVEGHVVDHRPRPAYLP